MDKKLTHSGSLNRRSPSAQRELPLRRGQEQPSSKILFQLKSELNRLQQRDREWKLMFNMLGHDLKEPLVTLEGFTKLLENETTSAEDRRRYLKIIREAINSLHLLVGSLQSVSKLYHDSGELLDISLQEVINSVTVSLSRQISKTKARVEVKCDDVTVRADPVRLYQIFLNLIANSLKFHKKDSAPVIVIDSKTTGGFHRISISDNGVGMSPEDMKRIFEPFTRLSDSEEGMGMGLSIVKRIAESFGGRVLVKSVPGQGTTFTVLLPREPRPKRKKAHEDSYRRR